MSRQIILASTSPRRREILKLLNIKFKAVDSGYKEVMNQYMPHEDLVKFLALGKAKAAARKYPKAIIIAADTIVSFKGKAIGKPKNKQDAARMLNNFSAKTHYVITGLAILDAKNKQVFTACDKTKVYFYKLSKQDIEQYLASGEAMDKAGAYGFMGKGFNLVKKLEGDATTDLGLPMTALFNGLQKLGVKI